MKFGLGVIDVVPNANYATMGILGLCKVILDFGRWCKSVICQCSIVDLEMLDFSDVRHVMETSKSSKKLPRTLILAQTGIGVCQGQDSGFRTSLESYSIVQRLELQYAHR